MSSGERDRNSSVRGRVAGAAAVGVGAALAAAWVAQHRVVRKSVEEARRGLEEEGLVVPHDVVDLEVRTDDGAHIHVTERGTGPVLLLLHGLAMTSDIWVHQFSDLAERHRVIAVDLRGHGRSVAGADGFAAPADFGSDYGAPALARMAADVRRVIDVLDLDDALLVGHSMGGMVALLAVHHMGPAVTAKRLRGLALVSTSAGPVASGPISARLARVGAPVSSVLTSAVERISTSRLQSDDARWWISRMGFGPEPVPAQVQFVEQLHHSLPAGVLTDLLPSLTAFDMWKALIDIDVPTLVVVGTRDRLTGLHHARRMAGALPHAQMVELPRCGHVPMLERRREFSHLLEEFVAKLG